MYFRNTFLLLLTFLSFSVFAQKDLLNADLYGTGNWDADSLGNHRVVLNVETAGDVVFAHVPWRRHDLHPENKDIIVVDATSNKIVENILPLNINREFGDIAFQADNAGEYDVYYLKHVMSGHSNYPTVTYPPFEQKADKAWLKKAKSKISNTGNLPQASLVQFQSIDPFNSFYPMEIIATKNEVDALLQSHPGEDYLLFLETRENSIRMNSDLPLKWIIDGQSKKFQGKVLKGEYFTFQIGMFAALKNIGNVEVEFSALKKNGETVAGPEIFSSFNTGGTDWKGQEFDKVCNVAKGTIQPFWVGVDVPVDIEAGEYSATVFVKPENAKSSEIQLTLIIDEETILSHGDDIPNRMTRLRWLNSTLAEDNDTVAPYTSLKLNGNTVGLLGREVTFGTTGFPEEIKSYYSESVTKITDKATDILAKPVQFIVGSQGKTYTLENPSFQKVEQGGGAIAWNLSGQIFSFDLKGKVKIEFDGNIDYELVLTAQKDLSVDDIRLEIPMTEYASKYMMGLGEKGGYRSGNIDWKWAVEKNQDGPWLGNVNGGLQARFRDDKYSRPLNTNFYQQKPLVMPDTWYNNGKGGIKISGVRGNEVLVNSYSGEREVEKGEQLHFYFNLLITPFHVIETEKHWHNRYYHSYQPLDTIAAHGANVINVHHATDINPFINYPFFRPVQMKQYIDSAHDRGMKVKIYYTVRELTNKAPELFMLRSLGHEIFSEGKGGGFSWLQEHLDSSYIAAWYVPSLRDAATINTGISRWHNFYVEGLNWLVKNVGIDGVYIDDLAFDRFSMMRIRKVLLRGNPGGLIDLHSANQFNPRDGFANSANLYLENLPYVDRLWFGEYFNYDYPPDFWLVETSGIPFGLMGEMLQDGGNLWRGMVFGMTNRSPWSGNPAPIWKVWDDFGIQNSEMIGYWDSHSPVSVNNENVKATSYVGKGKTLLAIGNWNKEDTKVKLKIDWEKLGLDKKKVVLELPEVAAFQNTEMYKPGEEITVPGGKGFLIIVHEK